MKLKVIKRIVLYLITTSFFLGFVADNKRIMAHMESEKLISGKKIVIRGDVFYSQSDGRMVVHYTYPQDYFFVSNTKGEVQLYLPEANQVMIQRNPIE